MIAEYQGLHDWLYVALATNLALFQYAAVIGKVGWARGKYGIKAPATTGNPDFERCYRVQMNTLEQLIIFLPSMWMFGVFLNAPQLAAFLGFGWIFGRVLYAMGYYKSADKRHIGSAISGICTILLLLGTFVGILKALL